MADEHLDLTEGWCCNGKTWAEHARESPDGTCCQPKGKRIEDLPEDGQVKARERLGGNAT